MVQNNHEPTGDRTILFLIGSSGIIGGNVLKRFISNPNAGINDVRVIISSKGDTIETLEMLDLPYRIANDSSNPRDSVKRITSDGEDIDFLISCGWEHKIPNEVTEMATHAINCHPSYLPDYKGTHIHRPQWAHAVKQGGATIHKLSEKFDEGDIICRSTYEIMLWDTPLDLVYKSADIIVVLLREAILLLENGFDGTEQEKGGRYYSKISWKETIKHGVVNHILRAIGSDTRWLIEPTSGEKSG